MSIDACEVHPRSDKRASTWFPMCSHSVRQAGCNQ